MELAKKICLLIVVTVAVCNNGCDLNQQNSNISSKRFADEIRMIRDSLTTEHSKYPHQQLVARLSGMLVSISNQTCRTEAVKQYATMLSEVELSSLPDCKKATSVRMYGEHVCFMFRILIENGVPPDDAMSMFFGCLEKYRSLCMVVPVFDKTTGESQSVYQTKVKCACALTDAYNYTISIIRQFWLPNLSDYLIPEYHDKFKCLIEPFLTPDDHAGDIINTRVQ